MIGNRLREERLRLEMSQDAFSQHCGVTKNTQVSYEKGRRSPDTTYLLKAIEIGVDVLYVVTGRHVPAAVKALTQEQLDILNYMSGMSEQKPTTRSATAPNAATTPPQAAPPAARTTSTRPTATD